MIKNSSQQSDQIYSPDNISLFETLYGKNLCSLGGLDAIDNMFSDVDLRKIKALDVGFGLGGVAFYLAEKYQIKIAGVEIHDWMVTYAETHAPKNIVHLLEFSTYHPFGEIPYQTASFDLTYSKGVLNHVRNKQSLFLEINRVLKKGGLFVIADWIYHHTETLDNSSPLVNETKESYQKVLQETGFTDINFRDDSFIFIGYVKRLLKIVRSYKEFIEKEFGSDIYSIIVRDHEKLIDEMNHKKKFATRIKAKKL